ncbi:hypothetical protein [Acinetobacter sp. ANC 3813]|uniref:hypothetical protein n=1 Tax=Acinetobacter sp. ANC 3813 TaxID=1977873 RepID=UPI000A34879B|nr:hypothetical protein [Acinetobacter sp. ANC 3813]OTG87885.1 hypothetical protein B9T34_16245 [Acinetobacter sp. ANC 3813]
MNTQLFPFLQIQTDAQQLLIDSAAGAAAAAVLDSDDINTGALNSEIQGLRRMALALSLVLADDIVEKNLEEGELPTDRLDTLIAGVSSGDDEEFEADQATLDIIIANVQDAMASLGVSDDLIATIFSEDVEANEAIEAAAEQILSNLPSSEDLPEFTDMFVYGEAEDEDSELMIDGVSVGKTTTKSGKFGKLVYKAVKAIRNGRVTVVNKRVSGKVKLSAAQRQALSKARRKASSSSAIKSRMRSMKKAKQMNI